MSVEELTREAVELIQLRQDNAALRVAIARITEDRDHWRGQYLKTRDRHQQVAHRLHATIKELFS